MQIYVAKQNTYLKKSTKPAAELKPGQKHPVPEGKAIKIEQAYETENPNYVKVDLAYGAGTWLAFISHWNRPGEKSTPTKHKVNLQNRSQSMSKTETVEAIVEECRRQGVTMLEQIAYILVTAEYESGFKPVREGYWLSQAERIRLFNRYEGGWRYCGKGYVQLTHRSNYAKYSRIIGLDLVGNPDLVMHVNVALFILVHGCKTGAFTGVKVSDYINSSRIDYWQARKAVNPGEIKYKRYHSRAKKFSNGVHKWVNYLKKYKATRYPWIT